MNTEPKKTMKLFAQDKTQELWAIDGYRNREVTIMHHKTEMMSVEGDLAMRLVERWGMIAATPDGEDSSGRSKARLQTPQELVNRAIEASTLLIKTLRETGAIVKIPGYEEIEAMMGKGGEP